MRHKSMATRKVTPCQTEIGQFIRSARTQKGISMRKMASHIGVSVSYMTHIELGGEIPTENRLKQIAEILDEDPDLMLALAGRVASDVLAIIIRHPVMMARMIRNEGARHD